MSDLHKLCTFWHAVNSGIREIEGKEVFTTNSLKYIHCLQCYSNEFWRYALTVFFYKNGMNSNFSNIVEIFLIKLTAFLYCKFIEKPTVNAIKDDIYSANIDIMNDRFQNFNNSLAENTHDLIKNANHLKIARGLLLLHAYMNLNQFKLIPERFEIEHIFPKKWQNTNYNGWNKEDAEYYLEKFGNKMPIEKKINIQAGNGYFNEKKQKYSNSNIEDVLELATYTKSDWLKSDIEKRDNDFANKIYDFFKLNS
jgi:hypothetical protein